LNRVSITDKIDVGIVIISISSFSHYDDNSIKIQI
jgi:hypothetical protein